MSEYGPEAAADQGQTHTSGGEEHTPGEDAGSKSSHTRSKRRRKAKPQGNGAAPVSTAEDVAAVLQRAREYLQPRIGLPKGGLEALLLWAVVARHCNHFATVPRLGIKAGTKGSGKTTVIDALEALIPKTERAESVTGPVLYRMIEAMQGEPAAILLDEGEHSIRAFGDVAMVLNAGWRKRSAWAHRTNKDTGKPERFYCFAPIAYAMNGRPHDTLADRSVILQMTYTDTEVEFDADEAYDDLAEVRATIEGWAHPALDGKPLLPEQLKGRGRQRWRAIYAVADALGLREWADTALAGLEQRADDARMGGEKAALLHAKVLFQQSGAVAFAPGVLAARMVEEFPDVWDGEKPLTANSLARLLGGFEIVPRSTVRARKRDHATIAALGGRDRTRAYHREDFEAAWRAYFPPEDVSACLRQQLY